ncbi:MAG: formyltransferase family protein [Candidatus Moraniibacteriota bacterium]
MTAKPRILVFASGSATGGGSGFQKMLEMQHEGVLQADIVGVVSNHGGGGVVAKTSHFRVPFGHWTGPFTADGYQKWVRTFEADYVMLSGWLKKVSGLDMARTVNIHPGPLPLTRGLYGHHVHERVMAAYRAGEIDASAVNIHFVDDEYDTGPIAHTVRVEILSDDTPEALAARVNACEHVWQSHILNRIVHGAIRLEGRTVVYDCGIAPAERALHY